MIGKTVSHYKILEELGHGGMGIVYKAQDTKLDRFVALKFLPPHISMDEAEKKRFTQEAKSASALDHNNICTIYEINETDDNQMFIAMGYYEGETLKDKITRGPLKIDEAVDIAIQMATGLEQAHKKEIVHRDIKPANIFITNDNIVKILDFGLAKLSGQTKLTKAGSTLGTVAYMSPEQTGGENVDFRTDIWSFGVVLYEMITGQLPFKGDYEQAVVYSILNEEPKPISSINSSVSREFEELVTQILAKNLDERFQNTNELLLQLKAFGDRFKGIEKKVTISQNKESKRKTPYLYAGLAVIFVLIILLGILFYPKKEKGIKISSIAVIPFSNTKTDPETDYLGFALADQIIGDLVYLRNITVRPSSSIRKYEKQIIEPIIVGDDLKVDYVLTGNFLKEEKEIRLTVELIEMKTKEMIWRERIQIEYKNAFTLQDIVSDKVIKGLSVQFTQDERDRMQSNIPRSPLAYEYYLRSISYPSTIEGEQFAIEMLKKSIELDSSYAPAYNQLGLRTQRLAQFGLRGPKETKRAEKYYLKALSINGELLSALGDLAMLYTETARTDKAVEITRQMLEINPNNASTLLSLGYIYRYAGMLNESRQEMEKAVAIDPWNSRFRTLGVTYMYLGEYEKAIDAFDIDEGSVYSLGWHGTVFFRQGNRQLAIDYFNQIIEMEPEGLWGLSSTVFKAFIQGNINKGIVTAHKFEQADLTDSEAWYYWAGIYGLLGDRAGCIRCLQRAIDGGYFNYPFMLTDFFLDPVRDDPEIQKVLEKAKEKHEAFRKRFF